MSHLTFHGEKRHFQRNLICTYTFDKSSTMYNVFGAKLFFFFKLTIRKLMAKAFQNTLVLYQYVFNSRSNLCTNLVHWNSLHPKKAILPTVLGQTPCFHSENHIPRTNNLHHRKAGTLAVILA